MYTEVSSGAIIVRQHNTIWELLCIRDASGNLTFPKGYIEHHESVLRAARREAKEETGITKLTYKATLSPITYFYTRGGKNINKTVHYALFIYKGHEQLHPQKEEGISELRWIPVDKADTSIGYPKTNIPIIQQVQQLLCK